MHGYVDNHEESKVPYPTRGLYATDMLPTWYRRHRHLCTPSIEPVYVWCSYRAVLFRTSMYRACNTQDARSVANTLKKTVRFLDVEKRPERTSLAVRSDVHAWEEGASDNRGRRPVVVLLGHFNHGKTTILDALLGPASGIAE